MFYQATIHIAVQDLTLKKVMREVAAYTKIKVKQPAKAQQAKLQSKFP